ncbi:PEP/pyruvate-binding domain-containing protein [Marmoricola sp. RAF53]|uniref:cyclic nucleotide-binding domain-containing protein n=1 Tax=Marmoricola sp. RAF53 TaxID=3233059 RepID=UPI003F9A54EB
MSGIVSLLEADTEEVYGAKAVGLGEALRAGLPVPPGVALPGPEVDAIASGEAAATAALREAVQALPAPLAVRSSAVGEDSAGASFAGQHITVLNVPSAADVEAAVREVWWSANSDSAITYRKRLGVFARPSVGVVVQSLLQPDSAGVMFTRNPITGADERIIEAAWGLGEAVVSGRVIPDSYRVARDGEVLERRPGLKRFAIRSAPDGGTVDEDVAPDLVEALCLSDEQLAALSALAADAERVYGPERDIEWAFAGGQLYLLQCRAVTTSAGTAAPAPEISADVLVRVPLFADLPEPDRDALARLFTERTFEPGETVTKEGAEAAAFYLIESGTATVTVGGEFRRTLGAGEHFGEIALIDGRARSATVTADGELVCQGLTLWDFQPLVQRNPTMAWTLLRTLAGMLREAGVRSS